MKHYCEKTKNKTVLVGIMCILIMIVMAFQQAPFIPCTLNSVYLTFSYRYGFIQRGFLGTIIDFLSEILPLSPYATLTMFQCVTMMLYFIVIAAIVLWSLNKWNDNKVFFIIASVYVMGFGYSTWFSQWIFGHSDVWLIILTVLAIWAVWKSAYEVAIPISVICMLIHQAYFFMYLNAVLLALAIKYVSNESKQRKRVVVTFCLVIISCILLFIYLQFFSHVKPGIEYEYIRNRSIEANGSALIDSWEFAVRTYLFNEKSPLPLTYGIQSAGIQALFEIIFMLPILVELRFYWRKIISYTNNKKRKVLFQIAPFGIITALPLFVMHADYGRWFHAVYFYEVVAIWLVNSICDKNVTKANNEMIKRISNNTRYYIALSLYWIGLGCLQINNVRVVLGNIVHYCRLILDVLVG